MLGPAGLPDPPRSSRATAGPAGESVRSDQHGQLLDQQHIPAALDGYQQLRQWAVRWSRRCWVVGGRPGVGRELAQRLVGDGEQVLNVPATLAAPGCGCCRSATGARVIPDDAVSVAVAARSVPAVRRVRVEDQAVVLHR